MYICVQHAIISVVYINFYLLNFYKFYIMTTNLSRKRRTTINKEIMKTIRKCVSRDYSIRKTAEEAEISTSSAKTLIDKVQLGLTDDVILGVKKGRPGKVNLDMELEVKSILTRDPAQTLKSLGEELLIKDINASKSSIARCIKNVNFSRKRLCKVPEERNSVRTMDARQVYSRSVQTIPNERLIFLDETGFNLHICKHYGYSPVNTKCYKTIPANRGKNISLMLAISIGGIVGHELKEGSFDGNGLINFINNSLLSHFLGNPNDILVMDNCRFHHRADVKQLLDSYRIHYLYLPAYSPQLSPIEEYFSHLKAKYTDLKPLSRSKDQIISRVKTLINDERISFEGWFRDMRRWLERGSARHTFE